jgi:hypothetical protein
VQGREPVYDWQGRLGEAMHELRARCSSTVVRALLTWQFDIAGGIGGGSITVSLYRFGVESDRVGQIDITAYVGLLVAVLPVLT